MPVIEITLIVIGDRQREPDRNHIGSLKESILSKGILHPPVVIKEGTAYRLIAGAHRLEAMRLCNEQEQIFSFDGSPLPPGVIPVTNIWDLSPAESSGD